MSDNTIQSKVYHKQGGNEFIVADGGSIDIETGGAFKIGGTAVTATAAEINAAAGTGVSSTELSLLDGALAGAVVVSKAAVYDASGKLFRSSASPAAAGTLISDATALTAELNAVTGANGTAGVKLPVAAADEIVVVINTNASNNLLVYPIAGSQINALGASNAFTVTPGQMAVFIGRSATLWYTAAATDTIAGLTSSAAELNFNDGSLAGTAVASKTLVLGSTKNVDTLDVVTLKNDGITLGAFVWKDVTVTAALLDAAGSVAVIAGGTGDQFKVRNIRLVGGGTNFGAGGDRLIDLTDGATIWTTIANADIETAPAATLTWGNAKLPFLTGTSDTASAAASAIRFQYSGGTTDHGGVGSIKFSVLLEKVA